jgi:phospholipid/cholesterol/gamma-HCH transport system substrate-binding protein
MTSRTQNIAVGAFVLAALALLVFGVYYLKETVPGQSRQTYHARFAQVSTLQDGDPVKVDGVKAGRVTSIALAEPGVIVEFEIEDGIRIPKDSEVRIQNIGLMGERQVGIVRGTSKEAMAEGGTFEGALDAGIAEAMGAAGVAIAEAEALARTLRGVVDSTVGRPEFAGRINALLVSTENLTQRLNTLVEETEPQIREGVRAFSGVGKEVDGLVKRQKPQIEKILRDGGETMERSKAIAVRGERAAAELEQILSKLNSGKGAAGALLNDTTLHRDLSAALHSADSLFKSVKKRGLDVNVDLF